MANDALWELHYASAAADSGSLCSLHNYAASGLESVCDQVQERALRLAPAQSTEKPVAQKKRRPSFREMKHNYRRMHKVNIECRVRGRHGEKRCINIETKHDALDLLRTFASWILSGLWASMAVGLKGFSTMRWIRKVQYVKCGMIVVSTRVSSSMIQRFLKWRASIEMTLDGPLTLLNKFTANLVAWSKYYSRKRLLRF